ncbi:hypothetical protein PoB_002293500 [Plakobranchus ocellatus]|uniref:Uncharacterized protein n=1 Tax=Plakobranchus ocellatus TaxID=259542 RepID=A0AAV3ZPC5_9GAST|nr:hypothetical protein PoB_002293500 [Plakobranchus ocellatus]
MNLTQKAKKKLVGSFSKRKKFKLTDENGQSEDDTFELPPPLPRSRPPLPDFSSPDSDSLGETVACLPTSFSLPAMLNHTEEAGRSNGCEDEEEDGCSQKDAEQHNSSPTSKSSKASKVSRRPESFRYTYSPVYSSLSDENIANSARLPTSESNSPSHCATDRVVLVSSASPTASLATLSSSSGYHSSSASDLTSYVPGGEKKLRRMVSDQELLRNRHPSHDMIGVKKISSMFKNSSKGQNYQKPGLDPKSEESAAVKLSNSSCSLPSVKTEKSDGKIAEQDESSSKQAGLKKSKSSKRKKESDKKECTNEKEQKEGKKKKNKNKDTNEVKSDEQEVNKRGRDKTSKATKQRERRSKSSGVNKKESSSFFRSRSLSNDARLGRNQSDSENVRDTSDSNDNVETVEEECTSEDGIYDTDGEVTLVVPDEERTLTDDIGIFEEVFEPTEDDISMVISSQMDVGDSDTTLDLTLSSDDREDWDLGSHLKVRCVEDSLAKRRKKERTRRKLQKPSVKNIASVSKTTPSSSSSSTNKLNSDGPNEKTTAEKVIHFGSEPVSSASLPAFDLSRIPRMDNSVLNKIKFFENYTESRSASTSASGSPLPSPSPSPSSSFNAGNQVSFLSGKTLNARLAAFLKSHKDMTMWTNPKQRMTMQKLNEDGSSQPDPSLISQSENADFNQNHSSITGSDAKDFSHNLSRIINLHDSDVQNDTDTNTDKTRNNINFNNKKHKDDDENSNNISDMNSLMSSNRNGNTAAVFKTGTFSNSSPRLNFSRFRRSGSIPETAAVESYTDTLRFPDDRGSSRPACQVCHHPVCTEENKGLPLLLCSQCEESIHRQPEYSGHLVLDISHRRPHLPSAPPYSPGIEEEEDGESDSEDSSSQYITEDQVDGLFVKHNPKIRNKSPSDLERKLKRKKALKKKISHGSKSESLEAALAQIADPEGTGCMDAEDSEPNTSQERRDSSVGDSAPRSATIELENSSVDSGDAANGAGPQRLPVRRQSRVAVNSSHFTVKFGGGDGQREDLEVVAAVHNTTLREAIESVLESRNLDINSVNIFIEKSRTPLPINSDTVFLVGNTLEIKEKDEKEVENAGQGKQRAPAGGGKSGTTKGNKQGRNSRRDSVGVVPLLLEPPPTKQRRGSLQLPFREHFFNKAGLGAAPDSGKGGDGLKLNDDNFAKMKRVKKVFCWGFVGTGDSEPALRNFFVEGSSPATSVLLRPGSMHKNQTKTKPYLSTIYWIIISLAFLLLISPSLIIFGGVHGSMANEFALRSAGTLLSRVRAPPRVPRPHGGRQSLRSP